MSVTLTDHRGYFMLADPPDGVTIVAPPPAVKKAFGPIDNIAVNFDVDVAKITGQAFATWLIVNLGRDGICGIGDRKLDRVSEDDAAIIDAVVEEIESKKYDK